MSLFRCPVCGAPLERGERAYTCPNRHSYDLAREGYAYLLPPNQKHSSAPGDDRQMAQARREFLSKGYYEPVACRDMPLACFRSIIFKTEATSTCQRRVPTL